MGGSSTFVMVAFLWIGPAWAAIGERLKPVAAQVRLAVV